MGFLWNVFALFYFGVRVGCSRLWSEVRSFFRELIGLLSGRSPYGQPVVRPFNNTELHDLASFGHTNEAQVLITKGADVNAKNDRGETPLHWAVRYRKEETAELLITNGADVHAKNKEGKTPLDITGDAAMRKILLTPQLRERGAL